MESFRFEKFVFWDNKTASQVEYAFYNYGTFPIWQVSVVLGGACMLEKQNIVPSWMRLVCLCNLPKYDCITIAETMENPSFLSQIYGVPTLR